MAGATASSGNRQSWYQKNRKEAEKLCKAEAEKKNHQVFLLGPPKQVEGRSKKWRECSTSDEKVSPAQYNQWFTERPNPQCSTGWLTGKDEKQYDMYAVYPKEDQVCTSMGIDVDADHDCTGKDMWKWDGGHVGFNSADWTTESYEAWGGSGTCVAYAKTSGTTCKDYCQKFGRTCQRGMDDAHHQVDKLNYWLGGEGKSGTMCTIYGGGHQRQTTAENGCLQKWGTQVCACK